MSAKRPRSGLLSRLAAPIANVARRVVGRGKESEDDEIKRLMEMALSGAAPAQLTDDAFQMATKQMLSQDDGAFQVKLHV
ncbi:MAG: hypothetical protein H7Y60_04405, partial [Rhodospirillaceae bacterium]|nr:hypothetical protein [Rhodospirillales bacterium]